MGSLLRLTQHRIEEGIRSPDARRTHLVDPRTNFLDQSQPFGSQEHAEATRDPETGVSSEQPAPSLVDRHEADVVLERESDGGRLPHIAGSPETPALGAAISAPVGGRGVRGGYDRFGDAQPV